MKSRLALAIAWLTGVVFVSVGGLLPDGYRKHVLGLADPQPYPLSGVAMFVLAVTVEAAALWGIIRPESYKASGGRVVVALALLVPVTSYFGIWLMHAPPYQFMHFVWLACVSLALLVVGVVSFGKRTVDTALC